MADITPDIRDKAKRKTPAELIRKSKQPSEKEFQKQVIDLAHCYRWRVAHFRTSMNARGKYQTAVAADGAGFPDLVFAKRGRKVIFAELKVGKNDTSEDQKQWLEALRNPGVRVFCWYPADWPEIENLLRDGA